MVKVQSLKFYGFVCLDAKLFVENKKKKTLKVGIDLLLQQRAKIIQFDVYLLHENKRFCLAGVFSHQAFYSHAFFLSRTLFFLFG